MTAILSKDCIQNPYYPCMKQEPESEKHPLTTHDLQMQSYESEYESPFDAAYLCFRGPFCSADPNAYQNFIRTCKEKGLFFEERAKLGLLTNKEKLSLLTDEELSGQLAKAEGAQMEAEAELARLEELRRSQGITIHRQDLFPSHPSADRLTPKF
jgi:hypothetical protein